MIDCCTQSEPKKGKKMVREMLSSWRERFGGRSSKGVGTRSPGVSCGVYREKGVVVVVLMGRS